MEKILKQMILFYFIVNVTMQISFGQGQANNFKNLDEINFIEEKSATDYLQFLESMKKPLITADAELFTIEGITWIRHYGETEYYLSPCFVNDNDRNEYYDRIMKEDVPDKGITKCTFKYINVGVSSLLKEKLKIMNIYLPDYIINNVNLYLPVIDIEGLENNGFGIQYLNSYGIKEGVFEFEEENKNDMRATLIDQGFESISVPNSNHCVNNTGSNICGWGDINCMYHAGNWSVWCAAKGTNCNSNMCTDYKTYQRTGWSLCNNIDVRCYSGLVWKYWRKFQLSCSSSDWFICEIFNGSSWPVVENITNTDNFTWYQKTYTISGSPTYFNFGFTMNAGSWVSCTKDGIYIDDLLLTGTPSGNSTAPTSASANPSSICSGLSSNISKSGGTLGTGASWIWYSGSCGGTYVGTGSTITVSPTSTKTYYVRAEGVCNQTSCASVTVTVKSNSTAPTSASANPSSICSGLSSNISKSGGTLGTGASWIWYSGSCGGTYVGTGSTITVSPISTTTYYVRAEGDCNQTSCASVTVTVKSNSTAPTSASASPSSICSGLSSNISKSGGTLGTGASWVWYSGYCGGTYVGTGSIITVSPTSSNTYYVRAEGDCNQTSCANVTVIVENVSASASNSGPFCTGSTIQLNSGGGSSYSWSGPGGFSSTQQNPTRSNATTAMGGTYSVTVTNSSGCTGTATTTVTVNPAPSANASPTQHNTLCGSCNGIVTASGGSSYAWSNGCNSQTCNNVCAGTHTVTVTSANGCTATAQTTVNNNSGGPTSLNPSSTPANAPNCDGSASVNPSGGTPPYTYTWSNGCSSSNSCSNLCAGTYYVTVTDNNSCSITGSVTVNTTTVEEISFISGLSIYPNPTTGELNIVFEQSKSEKLTLKLIDIAGREIWNGSSADKFTGKYSKVINMKKYGIGVYTLQIITSEGTINRKVVVE